MTAVAPASADGGAAAPGAPFGFKLVQEGICQLVRHMSDRRRFYLPTKDMCEILRRRLIHVNALSDPATRAALIAAEPGTLALVHDPDQRGSLPPDGEPLPLVLAASRSAGDSPLIEIAIKNAECSSLYSRFAALHAPAEEASAATEAT